MPLAPLPGRASANPCAPVPFSQTPVTPWAGLSIAPRVPADRAAPGLSLQARTGLCLGMFWWLEQAGWLNPNSWAVAAGQCPAQPKPSSQVGRADWRGRQGQHCLPGAPSSSPLLLDTEYFPWCWATTGFHSPFPMSLQPLQISLYFPIFFSGKIFFTVFFRWQQPPAQHAPPSLTAVIPEPRALSPPGVKSPRHPNTFPLCSHSSELLPGFPLPASQTAVVVSDLQASSRLGMPPQVTSSAAGTHQFSAVDTGHQLPLAHASAACRAAVLEAWQNKSCLSQRAH